MPHSSNNHHSRRTFIRQAALGGTFALSIPQIVSSVYSGDKANKISLNQGDVILFQGDSITDAGRNREETTYNSQQALGAGYALLASAQLLSEHAKKQLQIYNKGVSGHKVFQLAERWQQDTLNLQPDVLSVLIGVNDFWHTLTSKYEGTIDTYRQDFERLMKHTRQQMPEVRLIIGEPFAVKGIKAVDDTWYPEFEAYQQAAREVAAEFDAIFIPYQSIFDQAQKVAPGSYWTYDGVHPSLAGSQLMAEAWLKTIA